MVSKAAEEDIADALFAPDLNTESSQLKAKQSYIQFATKVGDILYEGENKFNIPFFYQELVKGMNSIDIESSDLKKIVDSVTVVYNSKIAEEKKKDAVKQKAKKKP